MIAALQAFDFGRGEVSGGESQESMRTIKVFQSRKIMTASLDVNMLFECKNNDELMMLNRRFSFHVDSRSEGLAWTNVQQVPHLFTMG